MRLLFSLIGIIIFSCTSARNNLEKNRILPLTNADNFLIYYVFAEKALEKTLKEEMINRLKKFGTVFPGDDNKLTKQEKENKYKIGQPILDVIVSPIAEGSTGSSDSYKQLPVIELSVKIIAGVQLIENGSKIPGVIWEDHRYVSTMNNKEELIEKAVESLNILLDKFKVDYQKANPPKKGRAPQFYLYY